MPHDTPAARFAKAQREEAMTGPMFFNPELAVTLQVPQYSLFIFNVGPISYTKGNSVRKGSAGNYEIEACEKDKPFSRPCIIPSIVTDTYMVENQMLTHAVTGEFMCRDIVHPFLAAGDGLESWSIGQNLDDLGIFWTRNNPPTNDELAEARAKLEKSFRLLLAEANVIEAQGRLLDITPLMRHAADYFHEDRSWNKIYRKTAECPACGAPTKEGTAVHTCGAVLDWTMAIKFGLKTLKDAENAGVTLDVPEEAKKPAKKK